MRRLSLTGAHSDLRARRWDVLVLGSAVPGLVAAARLAAGGLRVLVVEEADAARTPELLREPFWLTAGRAGGVLDGCLRALNVPLIQRRALEPDPVALQVLLADARVDVGEPARTAEEWVAWGLAKPDVARRLATALATAGRAESEALVSSSLLKRAARPAPEIGIPSTGGDALRGLPAELAAAPPAVTRCLDAQLRAFSNLSGEAPGPEAKARLLGAPFEGGACFREPGLGLRTLLRRRLEALHVEFRTVGAAFELVEIGGHPGLSRPASGDAWLGRALVVNAQPGALAAALEAWEHQPPAFLEGPAPRRRRAAVWLRAPRDLVPEAMAPRVVLVGDGAPEDAVCITRHPSERGTGLVEMVATRVVENVPGLLETRHDEIEAEVRELLPFADDRLERMGVARTPRWDDELALCELGGRRGWPAEQESRVSSRPPIHRLPREGVAGLGVEGDLLLGWRAGDAIARELG